MRKYHSIENYSPECLINLQMIFPDSWKKVGFYAQEKIHGANFSIQYEVGGEVRFATRNHFIKAGENFYGYERILGDDIGKRIKDYVAAVNDEGRMKIKELVIYGEICGGVYPGYNNSESARVQKGVMYSPDNRFIVFDVCSNGDEKNHHGPDEMVFYSPDDADVVCEKVGLDYLAPLRYGTISFCLEHGSEFNSTMGRDTYGLPEVPDNPAEGIVIKTFTDSFRDKFGHRFVMKVKGDKWKEKARAKKERELIFSDETIKYHKMTGDYCNENRLNSAISKIGKQANELTMRDFGALIKEMAQDATADFVKDNPDFVNLEKPQQTLVRREIGRHCQIAIKAFFAGRS